MLRFSMRFQQFTAPVVAKGDEDTAFYRYNRLIALNEVGGDPSRFGITVGELHAANAKRSTTNLLITSTHDTKRSGDVRARIGALTEFPDEWAAFAREWVPQAPDPGTGFFVLQTLLGTGAIDPERLDTVIEKSLREAKLKTNWADPDEEYEASVKAYARTVPTDTPLHRKVAAAGRRSAMGQLMLKLTAPGIPDIYGGDEVEYLALVDPDNRRPIDFAALRPDGKTRLIREALALRKRKSFDTTYEALDAGDGAIAYLRGDDVLVGIPVKEAPRLPRLKGEWRDVYADDTGLTLRERV
jgi:(1->4)-alpha-D-glucan 1-alpha-D-glucosylmutase